MERRSEDPSPIQEERAAVPESADRVSPGRTLPLLYVLILAAAMMLFLLIWGKETQNLIQALIKLVVKG